MNNNTRVVVTGMGAVTPIGNDVETFWEGLKAGKKVLDRLLISIQVILSRKSRLR